MSSAICLACGHDHGSPPAGVFIVPEGSCNFLIPHDGLSCRITVKSDGTNIYAKQGELVECHCPHRIDRDVPTCFRERHGPLTAAPHERFVPGPTCDECVTADDDSRRRYELAEAEIVPLREQIAAVWAKHGLPNYDEESDA